VTRRAVDHVMVVVADLDRAAARILADHGLDSVAGGRHTGHGTANRIVPLGASYLELMGVVDEDEAAGSPMGRWALGHRRDDPVPAGLCLRTDDIDAEAARLGLEPVAMTRTRPDGAILSWRLVGVAEMFAGEGLPFFIQWDDPGLHPGRTPITHRVAASGVEHVELRGDLGALRRRVGTDDLPLTIVAGPPGITATIGTTAGPIVIG
jgi:hypothetical protein